jgi:hypothetical protein
MTIAKGNKAPAKAEQFYAGAGSKGHLLQRSWDGSDLAAKTIFVTTNLIELSAMIAQHRRTMAISAADRAGGVR